MRKYFLIILLIIGTIYFWSSGNHLNPDGDAIEFITAGYCNGIPHASGYPVFISLSNIFIKMLRGIFTIPKCVYLLNIILSLISLYILLNILNSISLDIHKKNRYLICIIPILFLSFSKTYWLQSINAEVYLLHLLVIISLIYYILLYNKLNLKQIYLTAIIFGIGMSNHLTIVFILPVILYKICISNKKFLIHFFILVIIVITFFYGTMMLRARNNPELNINNPDNITRLIKVITMYQYKDIRDTGKLYTKAKLQYLKDNFQFEFGYVFLIISLTGLIYLYKTEKQKFYYLTSILILFLLSVFVFYKQMSYTNVYDTIYVFYLPVYLILTISFCYGLKFLYYFFTKFSNTYFYIISLVLIIIISANFINNFQYNNFNKIDLLEQHYKDIITEINKTKVSNNQSYIFTREETMTYVSWYYRIVENKYRNYKFIFPELLEFDWYKNLYNINEQDILKLKNKSIDNLYKYKFKIYKKTNNWYRIGLLHKYNIGNIQIEYGSYNTDKNLDLYKTNLHIEIKKILDLYSNVYLYKGIVLMKNKNYEKAYNFFIKSIKYNENNKQTQYNLEVIKNIIKN